MPDPLALSIGIEDLRAALTPTEQAAVAAGGFNPSEVWYEFITMEDDRVRPGHRALHGSVWKAGDPNAPVPPLSWGCRCVIRYVAPPGSQAARKGLLPPSPQPSTDTVPAVYAQYLKGRLPGFDLPAAVRLVEKLPPADQVGALVEALQKAFPDLTAGQARDLARMAIQAQGRIPPSRGAPPPPPLPPPPPPPEKVRPAPLPGVGPELGKARSPLVNPEDGHWRGSVDPADVQRAWEGAGIRAELRVDGAWKKATEGQKRQLLGAVAEAHEWAPIEADGRGRLSLGFYEDDPLTDGAHRATASERWLGFNLASESLFDGRRRVVYGPAPRRGEGRGTVGFDVLSTVIHESAHARTPLGSLYANREAHRQGAALPPALRDQVAREVSSYAASHPNELIAEVYNGYIMGERYSDAVMSAYRRFGGPPL